QNGLVELLHHLVRVAVARVERELQRPDPVLDRGDDELGLRGFHGGDLVGLEEGSGAAAGAHGAWGPASRREKGVLIRTRAEYRRAPEAASTLGDTAFQPPRPAGLASPGRAAKPGVPSVKWGRGGPGEPVWQRKSPGGWEPPGASWGQTQYLPAPADRQAPSPNYL